MDKKDLNKIQKILNKEKKRLDKELAVFAKKGKHGKSDYQSDFPDFGDQSDENAREVAAFEERLTMEKTLEKEMRDVLDTLDKIVQGKFDGKCKYCKKDIAPARLVARPTSSTCIECKKKFKREN